MTHRGRLIVLVAAVLLAGCAGTAAVPPDGGGPTKDAGTVDAGAPDGGSPDGGVTDGGRSDGGATDGGMPLPVHAWLQTTGGGGTATGPSYRLRLNVGAPQPVGTASDAKNRVGLGVNAGP